LTITWLAHINTARQLLSALATYKVFSSSLKDNALVVDPLGAPGYKPASNVSNTFLFEYQLRRRNYHWHLLQKIVVIFAMHISFGLSPTLISAINLCIPVSKNQNLITSPAGYVQFFLFPERIQV